ncbi:MULTISPECIES: hypothetical protein [unclassified Prochlorococcus]|uniref:hypothetical protein n=1 Tax=unclassified Prochlorococcus TaxID=2627481 RepID=UPI000533A598|nr:MULTISPECIES: hypothetical protein [unclassified Prochlorococcus]KGG14605.1 Rod shape-determining protein MreD [Prochlorococcus sp. MIT 0602]KGG15968.1 Rod shape-determining protein MreD [Prochlorococcus sp. MIT 0603]
MKRENKRILYQFLGLTVPFFTFLSPSWLAISGVGPRWALIWLLPWALEEGPVLGLFAGLCLGIILDGMNLDGVTEIPALMLLGYWWGRLGIKEKLTDNIFALGFLIWIGSFLSGLSIWFQQIFAFKGSFFNLWAFYTILAGSIISGLISPFLCSSILNFFFKGKAERSS